MAISKFLSTLFTPKKTDYNRQVLEWVADESEKVHGLHRMNWEAIYSKADRDFSDVDQDELWSNIAYSWLRSLQSGLGEDYAISESANFILLSCQSVPFNKALLSSLEMSRRRLLRFLEGVALDDGVGKFAVMVFEDADRYYDYVSYFGKQEGTFGLSGGMFVDHGYGHLIFPHGEIENTEVVAAHEMSHALVRHLNLPLWLDEGIAVNMEAVLKGYNSSPISHEMFDQHQNFWNEETIKEFWSGESFIRPDEGQSLSYQLARILVFNLVQDFAAFVAFCNQADWKDAGNKAMLENYGLSLQDLLFNFLGESH